jgi:hypothetical protein
MAKKKQQQKKKKEKSGTLSTLVLASSLVVVAVIAAGIVRSQVRDRAQKVNTYYGDPARFERPACVVYKRLIEATPEHQELTRLLGEQSIGRDDPETRELMASAEERVANAIARFAEENECDLVCEVDYWKEVATRGASAGDVTDSVLEIMQQQ